MSRIIVVGGGFAGMSAAARLAKLRHDVTIVEASADLGGQLLGVERDAGSAGTARWHLSPVTVTLPGVFRDLFRKSGRTIERALDLVPASGRRHVFGDGVTLDLPMGNRSSQHDAMLSAFGADEWSAWIDDWNDTWDAWRRVALDRVLRSRKDFSREQWRELWAGRTLARISRREFDDRRLSAMVRDDARLDGHDVRTVPAFLAVDHYVARSFGCWRFEGGHPALAAALLTRLHERRVELRTGLRATGVEREPATGQVRGVVTENGTLRADIVVWCAPTLPASVAARTPLPLVPATRTLLLVDPDADSLLGPGRDVSVHAKPPLRAWAGDPGHWTIAHHRAEDPLLALARAGIDVGERVIVRHDLAPRELVTLGHWGWQWQGRGSLFARPGVAPRDGLYLAGAHAHPGTSLEMIGMASAAIAADIGRAGPASTM